MDFRFEHISADYVVIKFFESELHNYNRKDVRYTSQRDLHGKFKIKI